MYLTKLRAAVLSAALWAAPGLLHAQFEFNLGGAAVQVHSFAQQGFAVSNQNNFLTMNTSGGSAAMTDGGVNVSAAITPNFRVGAQAYARNIGQLGDYRVQLDWAYGDYKFADWFGIRAGKVKTVIGLYNDTQDMEFLQTWAILPQSVYPLDWRSNSIAHTGADIYGHIGLSKAGSLSYTGYYGTRSFDPLGGEYYSDADAGDPIVKASGRMGGADLRWTTPINGLTVGGSWADQTVNLGLVFTAYNAPATINYQPIGQIKSGYAEFLRGKWHFSAEYRHNRRDDFDNAPLLGYAGVINLSDHGYFVTAAYRVNKWLELGTYNSRYYIDVPTAVSAANHVFDQVATARFDLTKWWNVKVEGHFMNGYGDTYSAHGFYTRDNPDGLKPNTSMFVIRTGYNM